MDIRHPAQQNVAGLSDGTLGLYGGDDGYYSLLLVNNSVPQPYDFGHQNKVDDRAAGNSTIDLDDAARQMLLGLESSVYEQDLFDEVQVLDATQNLSKNFYNRKTLSAAQSDSLCMLYGADAILVLNQVIIYDIQETFLTTDDDYYAYLVAYCSSQWTFHPLHGNGAVTFSTADTLTWDAKDDVAVQAMAALPDRQVALTDMAFYSGEQLGTRLFPQWKSVDRYLYANKHEGIMKGLEFFRHQQWSQALEQWKEVYNSTKKEPLTHAYAAANCAVAAEMMSNYKLAIQWEAIAEDIFILLRSSDAKQQAVNLRYYRTQLEAREKLMKKQKE